MFNDCPAEIKKMIFARVRHMDLYEVSGVSQEWWTLTMATCSPTNDKYSSFWKFQVEFCNQMMPKEGGWKDWMFVEFTDDKSIELVGPPNEKMAEYLRRKEIRFRKLIYRGHPSILTNLNTLFPYLRILDLTLNFYEYDGKAIVLPDRLKLRLTLCHPLSSLIDVFMHLERVNGLHISSGERIIVSNIIFERLEQMHLDMNGQSTEVIKSLVIGAKNLSIVHVRYGLIDEGWLGLFPTNIKDIQLKNMRMDEAIMPLLGTANAFVERQLMRFICQDWTKIRLFKFWSCLRRVYDLIYVCRPQLLEEKLDITLKEVETPNGLVDSGNLQLKVLKLLYFRNTKCKLEIIVPKSVQRFEWRAHQFEAINFAVLFEDISTIEKLRINSFNDKKIQYTDFPHAVNLVSLYISVADDTFLASILRNCPSLKQLSLDCPQGLPFSTLSSDLKSKSVKQLTIIQPKDSIGNILGHFPCLEDLHLKFINMKTVTTADLAQLTTLKFVRIVFKNVNDLVNLSLVVNRLNQLAFSDDDSHLILGYSFNNLFGENETLSCVMGERTAFFRRYSSSYSKNDFIGMKIQLLSDCFIVEPHVYLKGVSSLHLKFTWPELYRITYDLQEFIANTSAAIQENNLVLQ